MPNQSTLASAYCETLVVLTTSGDHLNGNGNPELGLNVTISGCDITIFEETYLGAKSITLLFCKPLQESFSFVGERPIALGYTK